MIHLGWLEGDEAAKVGWWASVQWRALVQSRHVGKTSLQVAPTSSGVPFAHLLQAKYFPREDILAATHKADMNHKWLSILKDIDIVKAAWFGELDQVST